MEGKHNPTARRNAANSLGSLGAAVSLELLLCGLESAVAELGCSVNELELDLLQGVAAGLGQEGAAQGDRALLGARDGALWTGTAWRGSEMMTADGGQGGQAESSGVGWAQVELQVAVGAGHGREADNIHSISWQASEKATVDPCRQISHSVPHKCALYVTGSVASTGRMWPSAENGHDQDCS
jgi:hypothetical protein